MDQEIVFTFVFCKGHRVGCKSKTNAKTRVISLLSIWTGHSRESLKDLVTVELRVCFRLVFGFVYEYLNITVRAVSGDAMIAHCQMITRFRKLHVQHCVSFFCFLFLDQRQVRSCIFLITFALYRFGYLRIQENE